MAILFLIFFFWPAIFSIASATADGHYTSDFGFACPFFLLPVFVVFFYFPRIFCQSFGVARFYFLGVFFFVFLMNGLWYVCSMSGQCRCCCCFLVILSVCVFNFDVNAEIYCFIGYYNEKKASCWCLGLQGIKELKKIKILDR